MEEVQSPSEEKRPRPQTLWGKYRFLAIALFVVLISLVAYVTSRSREQIVAPPTPIKPTQGFAWPTGVVFTDDEQFKVLKREDALLQLGNLGREYYRKESHSGLTGGFYSGIPVDADFYICYASAYQLAEVIDLLDTRFQNNAWHRKDPPGYTIETIKELLQNNADVRHYRLLYSKDTPIGDIIATIYFIPEPGDHCSSGNAIPTLKADRGSFNVHLLYGGTCKQVGERIYDCN